LSVLTKVFVVLVTVLSVLLVAVVVTFAANQENLRTRFQALNADLLVAKQTARTRQAEQEAHGDKQGERLAVLEIDKRQLLSHMAGLDVEAATAKAQIISLRTQIISLQALTAQLGSTGDILSKTSEQQRQELNGLRKQYDIVQTRLITVSDLVNAKSTQVGVLTKELRFAKEQITGLGKTNEQLIAKLHQSGITLEDESAQRPPFQASYRIDGGITAVEAIGGDVFVQVNVGSNDGVESKMKFLVHDQGAFKGTLVIDMVDLTSSSGRMTLVSDDEQIVSGDHILSGIEQ